MGIYKYQDSIKNKLKYKKTLINIDSRSRNLHNKYISEYNPIYGTKINFIENSNVIKIVTKDNNTIKKNDIVIFDNIDIEKKYESIKVSFKQYSNYVKIYYKHNYTHDNVDRYIEINEFQGDNTYNKKYIYNIPISVINGIHKIILNYEDET